MASAAVAIHLDNLTFLRTHILFEKDILKLIFAGPFGTKMTISPEMGHHVGRGTPTRFKPDCST